MNKKNLSAILFGALMVTSTGTFVSCKDYDDDIDEINATLSDLKSQLSALQSKVDNGDYVTGVTKTADGKGMTFTFSKGSPVTVNLDVKDGAPGTAGTVVTLDKETKELLLDNEKTGIFPAVDPAKESIKVQDGFWYFLGANGNYENSNIPVKGTYVVDKGGFWTMNVPNAEGVYQTINLSKTAPITDLTACQIVNGKISDAIVAISYGQKLGAEVKFNGKTYAKDARLLSSASSLSAIVNPLDADATLYDFALTNSKGNKPFVISEVKANKTEKALSRAATTNKGVFDMTVAYASTDKCGEHKGTYALTTTTANGEVASAYDVTVTEAEVKTITVSTLNTPLSVETNKALDLKKCFVKDGIATVDGVTVKDLKPYIVDYYFEIADKTIAANNGITLNGDDISATKDVENVKVKVNYLLVNGDKVEGTTAKTIEVTFKYVAPETSLSDVEWTVNTTTTDVYLPLGAIQSSLTGANDTALPTIANLGWTWTDGKKLDDKTVTVNGTKYGKDGAAGNKFAGNEADWIANVTTASLYYKKDDGTFAVTTDATTIQTPLYIKFAFTAAKAFPGEYQVKLALKKAGSEQNDFEVPVKVTIKSPAESAVSPFKRLDAYFVGDEAVAYGTADGTNITYDLFSLYKDMSNEKSNVTFTETKHEIDGHTCAQWITANGNIKVGVYNNAQDADNRDKAYSTREFKAEYTVFGNAHIAKIVDTFKLTMKSEIAEGTLSATAAAAASGHGVDPIVVSLKNITAKDVYGQAYNLAPTYKQDTKKLYTVLDKGTDPRLEKVEVILVDDNAKEYLAIVSEADPFKASEKDAYSVFEVQKKSANTALAKDVACKVAVKVTDKWGRISTTEIVITLLK